MLARVLVPFCTIATTLACLHVFCVCLCLCMCSNRRMGLMHNRLVIRTRCVNANRMMTKTESGGVSELREQFIMGKYARNVR